jgi:predicted HicB family RNase H-like nuclease
MEPAMSKTAALSIRISEELKAAIDNAAEDDGRSTASLVSKVMTDWIEANAANPKKKA